MVDDIEAAFAAGRPRRRGGLRGEPGRLQRASSTRSTPTSPRRSTRSRPPSASSSPTTTRSATTSTATTSTFVGSIIPSFDTSAELSGSGSTDLVAKIKATGVKAVFSESSLPPKTAEAIGREAGVKVEAGEDSLYGDTLGPAGSAGDTYLDMERHNTDDHRRRAARLTVDARRTATWTQRRRRVRRRDRRWRRRTARSPPASPSRCIGPNGAGKSTLIKAILGLVAAAVAAGSRCSARRRPAARRDVAYVPQADTLDPEFPVSVGAGRADGPLPADRLAAPARPRRPRGGGATRWTRSAWPTAARDRFGTLSGGQRQRVLLARAIAAAAAAAAARRAVQRRRRGQPAGAARRRCGALKDGGAAVVITTHDLALAHLACDEVCLLNRHQFGFGPTEATLTPDRLRAAYGGHALELRGDRVIVARATHERRGRLFEPFAARSWRGRWPSCSLLGVLAGVGRACSSLLRRLAFVADALTHTVFPGVVIGYLLAGEGGIFWGALVVAAARTAVLLTAADPAPRVDRGRRAGGPADRRSSRSAWSWCPRQSGYTTDLTAFLFGRILTVTGQQLVARPRSVAARGPRSCWRCCGKALLLRGVRPGRRRGRGLPDRACSTWSLNLRRRAGRRRRVRAVGTILVDRAAHRAGRDRPRCCPTGSR